MKVAIVCGSPSSEFLAPFDDEEWEIWVLGNRLDRFKDKRVTRVFEIHDNLSEHKEPERYVEFLVNSGFPLITGEKFPVKGDLIAPYPYDAIESLFGSLYLTSSPAYMMGYAILSGAKEIGIYGVDLSVDDHEYFWQRPCMEAWIGFAKGKGIKVYIPDVSSIGKASYIEGRDWNGQKNEYGKRITGRPPFTQNEFLNMAETHNQKIVNLQTQIRDAELAIHTHSGAQQAYERLAKVARATEAGQQINSLSDSFRTK
jgi:hypothetical protein